jgi:hypothetical protein
VGLYGGGEDGEEVAAVTDASDRPEGREDDVVDMGRGRTVCGVGGVAVAYVGGSHDNGLKV